MVSYRRTSYANRGKQLEVELETTNQYYNSHGIAMVQKIPIPVKVLNLDQRTGKITSAFYEKKSTVDYIGTYEGRSIVFDAKETNVETRFDLKNIKEHQYQYLKSQHQCGAIAFLLVRFKSLDETYYLPFELLAQYMKNKKQGGRKSIPYDEIAKGRYKLSAKGLALLDYLSIIDKIIDG
ncbi:MULTISPECIES: Holliday junction resolvase RecU [unclassified Candidatus Frackibacter]|uniref:Holliday junction resolvase RecU n=1 Tax=unclassified Candidatus Frackibacter TaxID=2648818 RepID=UPI0008901EBF|nr:MULTISPECIES: Holliday junction resolvase RecU [unclassified Candidatus Frackibacter]SDB97860.1 recombination protein U [Candidatus Frackibacter sp. WG11]SEM29554.1 recombination protein U [Candidatus Frackibacter sp. WG12]SFL34462.1 recombination protein U [Candidatus Frackibacter sp. WG13]